MNEITKHNYPLQYSKEFYRVFGLPGDRNNLVAINIPYPLKLAWEPASIVKKITVHKLVVNDVCAVLQAVLEHYGKNRIKELGLDIFGGSYNFRKVRGGDQWSIHSWGLALDFDPEHNQMNWGISRARFGRPQYDFFFEKWDEAGWTSMGRAKNFDYMHVQAPGI
jgi:hypothetical protein